MEINNRLKNKINKTSSDLIYIYIYTYIQNNIKV